MPLQRDRRFRNRSSPWRSYRQPRPTPTNYRVFCASENKTVASVNLMPQLSFIDPRTAGQPDDVTMAETGLMALTHGVETFFRSDANPMTAVYARTATRLALDALHQLAGTGRARQ